MQGPARRHSHPVLLVYFNLQAELVSELLNRQWEIGRVASYPQRLDVGDGPAAGDVRPSEFRARFVLSPGRGRCSVAKHSEHVAADFELPALRHRRGFRSDVVGVV